MKNKHLMLVILCAVMLLILVPKTVYAKETSMSTDEVTGKATEVSTVAELRAALGDNAGANVKLTKDITITRSTAADGEIGVIVGEGYYKLDLNGYDIKYVYMASHGNEAGVPLATQNTKLLVINGQGNVTGGYCALEANNQFGTVIINGGTFKAFAGSGVNFRGGLLYVNGGKLTGSFYGISHENGIAVLNGGNIKSVKKTSHGQFAKKYGIIQNNIFKGNAIIEDIILVLDNLTIDKGSEIKLIRGGGLVVNNKFKNNGKFTYESGLKSIGGKAEIKNEFQTKISQNITFESLSITEKARLVIDNGATVTVRGGFSSEKNCGIDANNGTLKLLGDIDHKGHAEGVPELDEMKPDGGINGPNREEGSNAYVGVNGKNCWEIGKGNTELKVEGFSYDEKTNTIMLDNFSGKKIVANEMGDDLKLVLKGKNKVTTIIVWGFMYAGGLNISGTGSLEATGDNDYTGIILLCEGANSRLGIKPGVTINSNGIVVYSTKRSNGIILEDGLNISEGGEVVRFSEYEDDDKNKYYSFCISTNKEINEITDEMFKKVVITSDSIPITTDKPAKPVFTAKAMSDGIKISIKKTEGAEGYRIYMSTKAASGFGSIKTKAKAGAYSYTKKGLEKGTTYYFKVRSFKEVDGNKVWSKYSKVVSVKFR